VERKAKQSVRMKRQLESVQPVLMSRDLERSIRFYGELGFELTWQDSSDDPKYAVIDRDSIELHLQWHDAAEWGYPNDRPTYRFIVRDVDALYAEFRQRTEVTDMTTPSETSWGTREFHVRDPDRNGLQFYRPIAVR
jgi:catechol 2,3-dioxygenase-like lactoylglutathione lyase family enzyme